MAHKGSGLSILDTDTFYDLWEGFRHDLVNLLFVVSCLPIVTIGVAKISLSIRQSSKLRVVDVFLFLKLIWEPLSKIWN